MASCTSAMIDMRLPGLVSKPFAMLPAMWEGCVLFPRYILLSKVGTWLYMKSLRAMLFFISRACGKLAFREVCFGGAKFVKVRICAYIELEHSTPRRDLTYHESYLVVCTSVQLHRIRRSARNTSVYSFESISATL